jgi:hypothetical protein
VILCPEERACLGRSVTSEDERLRFVGRLLAAKDGAAVRRVRDLTKDRLEGIYDRSHHARHSSPRTPLIGWRRRQTIEHRRTRSQ